MKFINRYYIEFYNDDIIVRRIKEFYLIKLTNLIINNINIIDDKNLIISNKDKIQNSQEIKFLDN